MNTCLLCVLLILTERITKHVAKALLSCRTKQAVGYEACTSNKDYGYYNVRVEQDMRSLVPAWTGWRSYSQMKVARDFTSRLFLVLSCTVTRETSCTQNIMIIVLITALLPCEMLILSVSQGSEVRGESRQTENPVRVVEWAQNSRSTNVYIYSKQEKISPLNILLYDHTVLRTHNLHAETFSRPHTHAKWNRDNIQAAYMLRFLHFIITEQLQQKPKIYFSTDLKTPVVWLLLWKDREERKKRSQSFPAATQNLLSRFLPVTASLLREDASKKIRRTTLWINESLISFFFFANCTFYSAHNIQNIFIMIFIRY